MKTIFPDEIPEEMEDLREGTDSIEDSLKPIPETDEKLRKLSESTSSTLGKLTASSSMLSAFQGYRMNAIFRGFGELAISNAIPKYSFTNPVLQQLKENYALNMAGMHTATSALGDYLHRNQEQFRSITDSLRAISESYGNAISNLVMGIDQNMFEAANIDGASATQTFFKVTLPLLTPILVYTIITALIGGLQMFDVPQVLTNGAGTPNRSSMTLIIFLNNYLKTSKNYGMAGAISVIIFIVTGLLSIVVYRSLTKKD